MPDPSEIPVINTAPPEAEALPSRPSRFPGSPVLWIGLAAAVFALAIGLAFGLNGGDSPAVIPGPAQSAAASAPAEPPAIDPQTPPTETFEPSPAETPAAPAVPETPITAEPQVPVLTGFSLPIDGACVSEFEGHLPGALREYRKGVHEGLDFYEWASCTPITLGTPVLAAKDGTVLRADFAYHDLTQAELDQATAADFQGEANLDLFRGRQVWIDHGGGVVTRYAHLSAIAAGLEVGQQVRAGQIVGFVGESGTPESLQAPGSDYHLHFEIRVGDSYLGAGQDPFAARALYLEALGLSGQESSP